MNIQNNNLNYTPSNLAITSDPIAPTPNTLLTLPTELCYQIFKELNLTEALVLKALCKKVSALYEPYKLALEKCYTDDFWIERWRKEVPGMLNPCDSSNKTKREIFIGHLLKVNDYFSEVLIAQAKNSNPFLSKGEFHQLLSAESELEELQRNNNIIRRNIVKTICPVFFPIEAEQEQVFTFHKIIAGSGLNIVIYTERAGANSNLHARAIEATSISFLTDNNLLARTALNPLSLDSKEKLLEYYKDIELEQKPKYGVFRVDLMPGYFINIESTEKTSSSDPDRIKLSFNHQVLSKTDQGQIVKEMQSQIFEHRATMLNYYVAQSGIIMLHTQGGPSKVNFFRVFSLLRW